MYVCKDYVALKRLENMAGMLVPQKCDLLMDLLKPPSLNGTSPMDIETPMDMAYFRIPDFYIEESRRVVEIAAILRACDEKREQQHAARRTTPTQRRDAARASSWQGRPHGASARLSQP